MKKPVKNYLVMYPKGKKSENENDSKFYMCEYIDAWAKKPPTEIKKEYQ